MRVSNSIPSTLCVVLSKPQACWLDFEGTPPLKTRKRGSPPTSPNRSPPPVSPPLARQPAPLARHPDLSRTLRTGETKRFLWANGRSYSGSPLDCGIFPHQVQHPKRGQRIGFSVFLSASENPALFPQNSGNKKPKASLKNKPSDPGRKRELFVGFDHRGAHARVQGCAKVSGLRCQ